MNAIRRRKVEKTLALFGFDALASLPLFGLVTAMLITYHILNPLAVFDPPAVEVSLGVGFAACLGLLLLAYLARSVVADLWRGKP